LEFITFLSPLELIFGVFFPLYENCMEFFILSLTGFTLGNGKKKKPPHELEKERLVPYSGKSRQLGR